MKFKLYKVIWHYKGDSDGYWDEDVEAISKAEVKRNLAKKYGVKLTDIVVADCWLLAA